MQVLTPPEWSARQAAHERRVRAWTDPHLARTMRREKHPVLDFLFRYYSHSPGALRRWHPGAGVTLAGDPPHQEWPGYRYVGEGVTAGPLQRQRAETARASLQLLRATAARPPFFGCSGLHEWAMVYRASEVRHPEWPMRLAPAEVAAVVEAAPLRCTHFDAYRFFTAPARPLNAQGLTRSAMRETEQGGCLHTNMDLYKNAYRLLPHVPSELVADCFALARDLRELDMRASPYDLTTLGYEPLAVETPAGRAAYVAAQRAYAARAAVLRERLIELMERLLSR